MNRFRPNRFAVKLERDFKTLRVKLPEGCAIAVPADPFHSILTSPERVGFSAIVLTKSLGEMSVRVRSTNR